MELFFPAPRVFYDALRKSWFKQMTTEVTAFRDALEVCLYEMPRHPSTQWHDKFDRFVADQAAAGRELTPEGREDIRLYLDDWLDSLKPTMQLASASNAEGGDTWPALSEEDRQRTRAQYGLPGWYAKSLEWGDEEWEKVFESLGRESRDRMLEVCQQLSVLGGMAKDADNLADDGLDELANQKQRVQAAYDAYILSLVQIQRQWLEYINKHWFVGLQIQKLIARLEANLPPRLFDLSSTHLKSLATVSTDVNKALGEVVSRLDTAYKTALWTDRVIQAIEVLTAVGAIGAGARWIFKAAVKKGIAKSVAMRMAIRYGVKQFAVQASTYVVAGYVLPPVLAASGLNQDFVFTGLMVMQGLTTLQAVRSASIARAVGKPTLNHGPLDRDTLDNNFDLHPGSVKEKFNSLEEPDRTLLGPQIAQDLSAGVVVPRGVWDLPPSPRGIRIEQRLGQNLPDTFPVFDKFSDGVATSIKSLDTWMPNYRNPNSIFSACRKYVDAIADYKNGERQGFVITAADILERRLDLAVPPSITSSQRAALDEVVKYGQAKSVVVTIIEIAD